ncbi:MAG: hypothetical protein JW827_06565 [Spirochaetes bacterium]|nr:hypothetical protein [Spirochaetota bacterium]
MTARKIIVAVFVLILFTAFLMAETVGVLKFYRGKVLLKSDSGSTWLKPKLNMKLRDDFLIKAGKNSEARVQLKDGSIFTVKAGQIIKVKDMISQASSGKNKKSSLMAKLKGLKNKLGKEGKSGSAVTAVAGVRGSDISEKTKSPVRPTDLVWEE